MQLGTLVCLPKPRAHQGRVTTQAEFVQGSHRPRVPVQGPEDSNKAAPDWLSVRRCSCSRPREVDATMCLLRAFARTFARRLLRDRDEDGQARARGDADMENWSMVDESSDIWAIEYYPKTCGSCKEFEPTDACRSSGLLVGHRRPQTGVHTRAKPECASVTLRPTMQHVRSRQGRTGACQAS